MQGAIPIKTKQMNNELVLELIRILGEDKIVQAHCLSKNERISFAALYKYLLRQKLLIQLKSKEYMSVAAIAKKYKVSKMWVYRQMHLLKCPL